MLNVIVLQMFAQLFIEIGRLYYRPLLYLYSKNSLLLKKMSRFMLA